MKKACGSFLPTPKFTLKKKLTLLRINLKNLYFQIFITKLICSLGYNKYVAKLLDLVTPALDYSPAPLGDGTHQPTKKVLVNMDFPPHFDNLVLQLMFSHFFLATLSFTITFSIGQTSQNLGHCFVWSNLLLKCENITQLKREIVKVWREIHADKDLLRRLMKSIPKRCKL